jgi:hypothetical protein
VISPGLASEPHWARHLLTLQDKYTTFDKKAQANGWRKGVHKVPKWTKVSDTTISRISLTLQLTLRENPLGF